MAISKKVPNTIHLWGDVTLEDELPAIEAITPGHLVEIHNDSGTEKWGVADSADAAVQSTIALDRPMMNWPITQAYAAGDIVPVAHFHRGAGFYGLIPSGQTVNFGTFLQSNGDGRFKAVGSGTPLWVSRDNLGAITVETRCRIQVR